MLVVRIVGVLVAIAIGACLVLWLMSGDRKWLRYAWNLFRVALVLVVAFLLLLFAERLLVADAVVGDQRAEGPASRRIAHPGV
ncbi:MAG TPA: hypothetical protein VG873_15340 [Burkholderiales bacterium]|nr:hypothetical protein [Burkholderiales bacterium]